VADDNRSPGANMRGSMDKDSLSYVMLVAVVVCLVCSVVVSTAAVVMKPQQIVNRELDQKQNILRAAGVLPEGSDVDAQGRSIEELFSEFTVRAVDLDTGQFTDAVDVASYDPIKAAKEADLSRDLSNEEDIATIGRRENISLVYIRRTADGGLDKVVLPVRGYGLWGTLFGYLALEGDLNTVAGLGFYSQKETPGLGGEVDNPKWKSLWPGVKVFDKSGEPAIDLVKTHAPDGSDAATHEVDALAGATLTTRGVENLVRFWTGQLGFKPFLNNLKTTS